jgi:Uncharacterised nucleotidyltransferase
MQILLTRNLPEMGMINCPEVELLLCCSRTNIKPATTKQIKQLLKQDIDWEYLIDTANRHRVMPLLYWTIKNTCPELVPQEHLERLRKFFQKNNFNSLILTQSLIKLLNLLESNQINVLPFKGPLLASSVYGNLSLRQIADIDILVRKEDFQKVVDLLVAQGYCLVVEVPWENHLIGKDGITNIDIHYDIVPKHLSCSISDNYWWENLENFSLAGKSIASLSPEAWFLILCFNGNKECWQSLNRICDVAEVITAYPQLDWKQIMDMVNQHGCKRIIFISLLLANNILNIPIPKTIWQQAQSDTVAKTLADKISKELFSESKKTIGEVQKAIFHIKTRERLQDKITSFTGLMEHSGWMKLTKNDLEVVNLPQYLNWLYYLIRPIRVIKKYGIETFTNLFLGK